MLKVPTLAIILAGTVAVSWVALTKVVESELPFHKTVSPKMKLLPFAVSVKPSPPMVALEGKRELTTGGGSALIAKLRALEFAPLGGCTTTEAVPTLAMKLAGIAAVNCVELLNVVVNDAPFHNTTSPDT
jgi:hypothetical protein